MQIFFNGVNEYSGTKIGQWNGPHFQIHIYITQSEIICRVATIYFVWLSELNDYNSVILDRPDRSEVVLNCSL